MIYGGDGLGRLPANEQGQGKAVFVPFVLTGEEVSVSVVEERPGYARARLQEVVAASPVRTVPPCPYFSRCGGCHYQHTSYDHQLRIKSDILRETLQRTAKLTLESELQVHASEPWAYRNRTRLKVRSAPDFALGYYAFGTHDLLPVEECPISSLLINRALETVWEIGRVGRVPGTLREVQFFANHDDSALLLELYIDRNAPPDDFRAFAEALRKVMPQVIGVVAFQSAASNEAEGDRAPLLNSLTGPGLAFGENQLAYKVGDNEYRVSAGSFFQTNRFLASKLLELVTGGRKGGTALDLYAGTGLFTVPLSRTFERVTAVESAVFSYSDLKHNTPRGSRAIHGSTDEYLSKIAGNSRFDLVVVDPPRSGLGERTARALSRLKTPRLTYVSCDPSTLSRDLRVLLESGFRVEQAHLVDLFPQTFHMESVFQLVR